MQGRSSRNFLPYDFVLLDLRYLRVAVQPPSFCVVFLLCLFFLFLSSPLALFYFSLSVQFFFRFNTLSLLSLPPPSTSLPLHFPCFRSTLTQDTPFSKVQSRDGLSSQDLSWGLWPCHSGGCNGDKIKKKGFILFQKGKKKKKIFSLKWKRTVEYLGPRPSLLRPPHPCYGSLKYTKPLGVLIESMVPMCLYVDRRLSPPRAPFCKPGTAFGSVPDMGTILGFTPRQKQQRLQNVWSTTYWTRE
jgi:hypothetical protein